MGRGVAHLQFGLVLIPNPAFDASEAYPLNPPVWSLVYEIFANYAYALFLKRLNRGCFAPLLPSPESDFLSLPSAKTGRPL